MKTKKKHRLAPLFSSRSDEWGTPDDLFRRLDREFGFRLDVAASAENAKCGRYFSIFGNGLRQDWGRDVVWCNPPYGRGMIDKWVRKAALSARRGATVVCLVPSRTDTDWWHRWVLPHADEVRMIRGRLHFQGGDGDGASPVGSVIIVYRPGKRRRCFPTFSVFRRHNVRKPPRRRG